MRQLQPIEANTNSIALDCAQCPQDPDALRALLELHSNVTNLFLSFPSTQDMEVLVPALPRFSLVAISCQAKHLQLLATGDLSHLTHFVVHHAGDDVSVSQIVVKCPKLRSLSLVRSDVSDAAMRAVANTCTHLEQLDVIQCFKVTDGGLKDVTRSCAELGHLTVSRVWECVADLPHYDLYCQMEVEMPYLLRFAPQISDDCMRAIAADCAALKSLRLSSCLVTDNGLSSVVASCRRLTTVNLRLCPFVTDETIIAIASNCPNLQHLNLAKCCLITSKGILEVGAHCPFLHSLNIRRCKEVRDGAVRRIAEGCPMLLSLGLRGLPYISDCAVLSVIAGCPGLEKLSVDCGDITELSLSQIATCKNLTALCLRDCDDATLDNLVPIASNCHNLRSLDISGCRMNSEGIEHLVGMLPQLESFTIRCHQEVDTDTVSTILFKLCPQLQVLDIRGCENVHLESLMKRIKKDCPHLRRLDVAGYRRDLSLLRRQLEKGRKTQKCYVSFFSYLPS